MLNFPYSPPAYSNTAFQRPHLWTGNHGALPFRPAQFSSGAPDNALKPNANLPASQPKEPEAKAPEDASVWRDTALRYGGYADEAGEFLAPYLGGVGKMLGYGISSLYVLADMGTSLPKKYHHAGPELTQWEKIKKTGAEALDLSVFHGVATLLVPPMIIGAGAHMVDKHLTSDTSRYGQLVSNHAGLNRYAKNWMPWANQQLKPRLARSGQKIAQMMAPLENWATKQNPKHLKRIPIFGELLSGLPNDLKDLRKLDQFQFNEKNMIRLLLQKPIPVAVGLGMVPLVAHPFDELMIKVQNWTIRPLLGMRKIEKDASGRWQSVKNPTFWGHAQSSSPPATSQKLMPPNASGTVALPSPWARINPPDLGMRPTP
ncbi:hypothetical protein [Vampirovibrio sp.]|uniref:hypothetical protein n=1 Tax=Vampirovibrio sp. TaxID=2717857 RepID=UPI003593D83E